MASIYRLGHLAEFMARAVALNRLHNPDDPVHAALLMDAASWTARIEAAGPTPAGEDAIALQARKGLAALHHEFPAGAPVHEQAAYLLRGLAGLQPFGAASDLTAWDLVAETLEHHGFDVLAESEDARPMLTQLWTSLQATYPTGLQRRDLLERDDALRELSEWFRKRVVATGVHADIPEKRS